MERRPQPAKRVASRPMPAPGQVGDGRQPVRPHGAIELPDEYAGLDPDLRAFLRAPYDPLNSVMAARFIAGGLLRQPLAYGWLRHIALLVALVLVGTLAISLVGFAGLVVGGSVEEALFFALQILVISGPLGAFGAVLLWRLARY